MSPCREPGEKRSFVREIRHVFYLSMTIRQLADNFSREDRLPVSLTSSRLSRDLTPDAPYQNDGDIPGGEEKL